MWPGIDIHEKVFELVVGSCGAIIAELLHWHRIARQGRWPQYATSWPYWVITALVILAGGIVTAAVSTPGSSLLQLLLLGIAGPQLLQSAARAQRKKPKDKDVYLGAQSTSWTEFMGA